MKLEQKEKKDIEGAAQKFDEAVDLYNAEQYDRAVPVFKKLAAQGNAYAQNNLGSCYYHGNGVQQDYKKA